MLALSLLGFLFSVPTMCYILAYIIFIPIAKELSSRFNYPPISTATALALGAVVSFNLVHPSPVIISAAEELSANKDMLIILEFLIAVPTSTAGYLYAKRLEKTEVSRAFENNNQRRFQSGFPKIEFKKVAETAQKNEAGVIQEKGIEVKRKDEVQRKDSVQRNDGMQENNTGKSGRLGAYVPIFLPLFFILFQAGFDHPHSLFVFLGNPNIALLIGVLLSIFSSRTLGFEMIRTLVEKAVRRSGVVLLDLCGEELLGQLLP